MQAIAQQVLNLIDLTSLNDNDTNQEIEKLCESAVSQFGNVPAICIYSRFIPIARQLLNNTQIKIATVTNFPHGSPDIDIALFETKLAITRGADEVDIVFPYNDLIRGHHQVGQQMIKEAKKLCGSKTLKVIIESGSLKDKKLIRQASEISIQNGANFIKTSTGKAEVNATLEAAEVMLNVIKESKTECGFKAAGGVKTVQQAAKYLELAANIMGPKWANAEHFRFGASGLLTDVLNVLYGTKNNTNVKAGY